MKPKQYVLKFGFLVFVAALLQGCIAMKPLTPEELEADTRKRVVVEYDTFTKVRFYGAHPISDNPNSGNSYGVVEHVELRATKVNGADLTISVIARDYMGNGARYYNTAVDESGKHLKLKRLRIEPMLGRAVEEILAIDLPDGYLDKYRDTGVKIRIYSQAGSETFTLPSWYIKGFQMVVNTK